MSGLGKTATLRADIECANVPNAGSELASLKHALGSRIGRVRTGSLRSSIAVCVCDGYSLIALELGSCAYVRKGGKLTMSWRRNILRGAAIGVGGSVAAVATPALAYNGQAAADYAGQYAINDNIAWVHFQNDCTNFVSQALYAGGFPMTGYGGSSGNNVWWGDLAYTPHAGNGRSISWSSSDDLRVYLDSHNGGTASQGAGTQNKIPYTPGNIVTGDVVFYNWDNAMNPQLYDHVAIQVGQGTDPDPESGWIGNLVDTHTTNRGKAIWHLWPYNPRASTTVTKEYHIN
ncbi:hypothetical protein Franean1_3427 [Parafrankia sp. EAN1pec]|nr:hypothetical protein Franean1_3427 [Frankia sp. EAN1pec]